MAATRKRRTARNGQPRGRSQEAAAPAQSEPPSNGQRPSRGPGQAPAVTGRRSADAAAATGTSRLRVAVIDPHPLACEKVAETVEGMGGEVIWTAGTAAEALESAGHAVPDCAVFEFGLPDGSGAGVLARMRARGPSLWGVALSGYDDHAYRALTYLAGGLGYLSKTRPSAEVRAALGEVWAGRVLWTAEDIAMAQAWWARYGELWDRLSSRQRAVALGVTTRLAYKEIAARLGVQESTVKGYLREALAKIRRSTRDELAAWVEAGHLADPRVHSLLDLRGGPPSDHHRPAGAGPRMSPTPVEPYSDLVPADPHLRGGGVRPAPSRG
jgi:DNA-binding NarL/FixJ family response regulator